MSNLRENILVDAAERELAENDLSTTYLVEAAAGTGKTTLLVRRILTIVRETLTPLSRVVAITFTEKAAGDLKVKLRRELEAGSRQNDEAADRYRQELMNLDVMPVSTIHAFCRDLISQRPVEAGVEPGAGVLDDAASGTLLDEVWQSWIAAEFSHDCPAALPLLERGLRIEPANNVPSLRSVLDLLLEHRENLESLYVPTLSADEWRAKFAEVRSRMEDGLALIMECRAEDDLCLIELRKAERWYRSLSGHSFDEVCKWLEDYPGKLKGNGGQKGNWSSVEALARARQFCKDFEPLAQSLYREYISRWCADAVTWLKGCVVAYQQAKRERGVLDFQDLLVSARDMLKSSRAARDFFKDRYDYILVDEFQDTDPLQAEIMFFLAERKEHFATDWEAVELDEGRLFIVGDPKQSIYRFRRADLDLYGRVREQIEASGACLPIRVNFRSDPRLIREVNAILGSWMTGESEGRYEPEYVPMEPHRDARGDAPRCVFLPPPEKLDLDENSALLVEAEAACIAEYLVELIGSPPRVPGGDESRPLTFGDVAILYQTTTHLSALEEALRARHVPYQVSGGRNLPSRTEIQALRVVLAALDNPRDDVSVAGALRSPFFACSDEELLAHRLDGKEFDYTLESSGQAHVQMCFDVLRSLHAQRRTRTPSETLTALFEATTGLQVFALKPQGEGRVANLLKTLDIARSLESSGNGSFHHLVQWLDRLEDLRIGEEDAPVSESGDDVVQLMTYHKAKGLEFPVVVLYRLTHKHDKNRTKAVVARAPEDPVRGGRPIEMKALKSETAGFAQAIAHDEDRAWHEAMRLFYVALTRAREILVIPAFWTKDAAKEDLWLAKLLRPRFAPDANGRPRVEGTAFVLHDTAGYDLTTPLQERLVLDVVAGTDSSANNESLIQRRTWQERRDASAAQLDHSAEFIRPSSHEDASVIRRSSVSRADRAAAERFGLFVHAVLERIALPGAEDLRSVLDDAALDYALRQEDADEARDLLGTALDSELFRVRIATASALYRELECTALLEGRILEGRMDLVFIEGGEAVIVDFKTDRVTGDQARERARTYERQASVYARALETITGLRVKEALLYFLRPNVPVTLSRDELLTIPLP